MKTLRKGSDIEWIPAVVLSFSYICGCIGVAGISIVLAMLLWFIAGVRIYVKKYKINKDLLIISSFVILIFAISFIVVDYKQCTLDYFERFLLYDLIAFIVGMQTINNKGVLKGITIIGFVFLPLLVVKDFWANGSGYAMGATYMCIPILSAAIIGYTIIHEGSYKAMSIIVIACIIYEYLINANRGAWVIVSTLLFMMLYLRIARNGIMGLRKIRAFLFLVISTIVVIYGLINLDIIVRWVYDIIDRFFHIQIYALWKIQFYLEKGDVTNGRTTLFYKAFDVIKMHPITGSGIGYFEGKWDTTYVHNIILQGICEGGLFFLVPILWYIGSILRGIFISPFKSSFSDIEIKWFIFVFCCGLEMLFMSSVYWLWMPFWFCLGSYIRLIKEHRSIQIIPS